MLRTLAMLVYLAALFSAAGIVAGLAYDTAEVRLYVLGALGYMAVMVSYAAMFLPLGMRADIDRFDTLKSLPTASAAVVAGEIIPAGCLLSLVQCLLLGAGVVVDAQLLEVILGAACFTLPLNLLILGFNDLLFLLFPARVAAGTAASVQISARQFVTVMIFLPSLLVLVAMAIGCGAIVSLVLNNSALAFASGTWCAIWLEVAAIFALATWLFGRFDVSLETPPE
ncbi:MAG: hypothetical protein WD403_10360 [Pirellulales bacterium]